MRKAILFFIILGLIGIAACTNQQQPASPAPGTVNAPQIIPRDSVLKLMEGSPTEGSAEAKVVIVEFSDFECPFCSRFFAQTYPSLKKDYIDTGKARLTYLQFPLTNLHPYAEKAAEAALCADAQGKFWEMHDKLFTLGVQGGTDGFKQYASDLGLNQTSFSQCLDLGTMKSKVDADFSKGTSLGVTGTPTFLVNGRLISGAQPYAIFKTVIDEELSKNG